MFCSRRHWVYCFLLVCLVYSVINQVLWTVLHTSIIGFVQALNLRDCTILWWYHHSLHLNVKWLLTKSIEWNVQHREIHTCWCWLCPRKWWVPLPTHPVHFVTAKFASQPGHFAPQIDSYMQQVNASQLFTTTTSYDRFPEYILDNPTWKEHLQFIKNPKLPQSRGAGWWFWKACVIRYHLENVAQPDEFVYYSDVDRPVASWTANLMTAMMQTNHDLSLEQVPFKEWAFTKADTYYYFCGQLLTAKQDNTGIYNANWILIRNTPAARQFVNYWVESAQRYHLIEGSMLHDKLPNAPHFLDHRHDQSLLSNLLKCTYGEPMKEYYDYTCLGDWMTYMFDLGNATLQPFFPDHLES